MVDSIKTSVSRVDPQLVRSKTTPSKSEPAARNVAAQRGSVDKQVSVGAAVSEMSKAAPIDMEAVSSIKDAISRGEYPINLDRVADALMDAYNDLKG